MNEALISAVAALTGSAVGGITPIISNYLIQRGLTDRELTRELAERQNLYSEFIRFGTTLSSMQSPRNRKTRTSTILSRFTPSSIAFGSTRLLR